MKVVIQRVTKASVKVEGEVVGVIGQGGGVLTGQNLGARQPERAPGWQCL